MGVEQVQLIDTHGNPLRANVQDTAHFAASRHAREFKHWNPLLESADGELLYETDTIAARAYDLERNNGIAGGAVRTKVDNVVGTGLRLAARPDYRALGRDKQWATDWARITESKWRSFSDNTDFDAARQLTFGAMTAMQMRVCLISGDALALPQWLPDRPGAKWATAIQAIDSARLSNAYGQINSPTIRDGIEINAFGEPLAYWIRNSHPGDVYGFLQGDPGFTRVPARTSFGRRRVIHLYEKLRPGQSRGKSIFTRVMAAFRMLDHYQRTELQSTVANSLIAAFIKTTMNGEQIADMFGGSKAYCAERAGWDVKLQGSSIIPLFPGDELQAFNPGRPNTAYAAFVEAVLRYISTGLNIPYELLMKDFSKSNYSSARAAMLEAWRYFMAQREWLVTYWCDPIYELWLEEAVQRGEIEAPDFYENRTAYCACRWIGPGRGWVDPLKEAQAAAARIKGGISTLERELAEQGLDLEETLEQQAMENAMAEELGLPPIHAAQPAPAPVATPIAQPPGDGDDAGSDPNNPDGQDDGAQPPEDDQ